MLSFEFRKRSIWKGKEKTSSIFMLFCHDTSKLIPCGIYDNIRQSIFIVEYEIINFSIFSIPKKFSISFQRSFSYSENFSIFIMFFLHTQRKIELKFNFHKITSTWESRQLNILFSSSSLPPLICLPTLERS